jgi:hypothetical protein
LEITWWLKKYDLWCKWEGKPRKRKMAVWEKEGKVIYLNGRLKK